MWLIFRQGFSSILPLPQAGPVGIEVSFSGPGCFFGVGVGIGIGIETGRLAINCFYVPTSPSGLPWPPTGFLPAAWPQSPGKTIRGPIGGTRSGASAGLDMISPPRRPRRTWRRAFFAQRRQGAKKINNYKVLCGSNLPVAIPLNICRWNRDEPGAAAPQPKVRRSRRCFFSHPPASRLDTHWHKRPCPCGSVWVCGKKSCIKNRKRTGSSTDKSGTRSIWVPASWWEIISQGIRLTSV